MRRFPGLRVLSALGVACFLVGAAGLGTGEEAREQRNVALLRMELPRGFSSDDRGALANRFLSALHGTGRFEIVAREDMAAILQELKFQASDLVDEQQVVELGRLVGVDLFATCSVKSIQGIYQITAQLIGVETGRVEKIVSRRCQAKVDFLAALFNEIAFELAGEEQRKGSVLIETDPPEAEVSLFGVALGASPLTLKLAPGVYLLSVDRHGYVEQRKTLYVDEGRETAWKVKLAKQKGSGLGAYIRGMGFWTKE